MLHNEERLKSFCSLGVLRSIRRAGADIFFLPVRTLWLIRHAGPDILCLRAVVAINPPYGH